jgi:hypothetical protein
MWGPGGLPDIVMQFTTAALQHVSRVVQHVLPAVRKRSPQLAAKLVDGLQCSSKLAGMLCITITSTTSFTTQAAGAGHWCMHLAAAAAVTPPAALSHGSFGDGRLPREQVRGDTLCWVGGQQQQQQTSQQQQQHQE